MFKPRFAALVCEGHTDVPILRAVLQKTWPELESIRCLQPELDETDRAKGPSGWSQVRAWCQAHADDLEDVLDPDLGNPIDLLLVAIDLDIAIEAGIANPPRSLGTYETKRLRDTMAGWLTASNRPRLPSAVLFSTPVMAIEAWIVAAMLPTERSPKNHKAPAELLVKRTKLRRSPNDGKPWKELHRYRDHFAPAVARKLDRVRKVCAEANRTVQEVERRRRELETES